MEKNRLCSILEGLLFVAEEPISAATLAAVVESEGVTASEAKECLNELKTKLETEQRGFVLREVAGGYQLVTPAEMAPWIQKLNGPKAKNLSQPSLETLSIIAYRQPMVRSEIEQIRGVDTGGVLKTLLERGLIRIVGRKDEPGQPLIYGTSPAFLELFDLKSLEELPSLSDIDRQLQGEGNGNGYSDDEEEEENLTDSSEEDEEEEETDLLPDDFPDDDEAALGALDQSLKKLKKLEKEIFPKQDVIARETEATEAIPPLEIATPPQKT